MIAHFDVGTEGDIVDRFDKAHDAALIQDLGAARPHALKSIGEEIGMEWMRIQQAQFMWYQQVFEGLWLCMIIWLLLSPGIFRQRPLDWAMSVGVVPFLFMLPVYLGYQSTITTTIGPTGGGLYTWLVLHVPRVTVGEIDHEIRLLMPQLLSGLSFHPGSVMAFSGRVICGPLVTVIAGVIAGTPTWFIASWARRQLALNVPAPAAK